MNRNYRSQWDREARVGAMTRAMMRDSKNMVQDILKELYRNSDEIKGDYRDGCAEWHWNIVSFCSDDDFISTYTGMLEIFYRKKIDPRRNEKWKKLMRREFPQQFIKKVNNLKAQVPIIAAMDNSIYEEPEESDWWELEE